MVYDTILVEGQTWLKLQWMYGILAHFEMLRCYKELDFQQLPLL